ncbi:MAG: restriction endonuclease [Fimbriimonadales bacterium]
MQERGADVHASPEPLAPTDVRYIKLGSGGAWAKRSLADGYVSFGYHSIPHDACERKDWDEVRGLLSDRRSEGAITAGVNEVATFYAMPETCLWITIADGHLWWAFANTNVVWVGDGSDGGPSRFRPTIGSWRNTDINGRPLHIASLSSKLTKVANFRATICTVAEKAYLLRRINGIEEPVVAQAREARERMIAVAVDMIQGLHWADFETLTDLIFARSGWQRSTRVGETMADVDLVMEQPTTGERAFVQVKSKANQAVLDDYVDRFRGSGYDRFFFVCHSAQGALTLHDGAHLHLFEGERLADAAVKNGLFDWLMERSG